MRRFLLVILMVALLLGLSSTVLAALTTYSTTIGGTQKIDIDTGAVGIPPGADLWWEIFTTTPFDAQLVPENGAEAANLGVVDFDSVCDASLYTLSTDPIPDENLQDGSVIVIKTNLGKYAKMRIDSFGYNLDVTVTYQDDGTPNLCPSPVGGTIDAGEPLQKIKQLELVLSLVSSGIIATILLILTRKQKIS